MGGWDPRAGPESPLDDQTGSGQLDLKISEGLRDIFKAREWRVGKRKLERWRDVWGARRWRRPRMASKMHFN